MGTGSQVPVSEMLNDETLAVIDEHQVHDKLSEAGLKEFRNRGTKYYDGYCDALEWVLNHAVIKEVEVSTDEED